MTNPTIETDIAEVLKSLQQGQEKLLVEMHAGQKEVLEKVEKIDKRLIRIEEKFEAQQKIVAGLESSQNKQIWALIALAFTAVVSLLVGLGKFIFFPNP